MKKLLFVLLAFVLVMAPAKAQQPYRYQHPNEISAVLAITFDARI